MSMWESQLESMESSVEKKQEKEVEAEIIENDYVKFNRRIQRIKSECEMLNFLVEIGEDITEHLDKLNLFINNIADGINNSITLTDEEKLFFNNKLSEINIDKGRSR